MTTPTSDATRGPSGPLFWCGALVGSTVVAVATVNLVSATPGARLRSVATFVLGAGVAHDALWAPAVVAAGAATTLTPRWTRVPIRLGLALTALTVLFTWPEVRGYGRRPRNPSVLPLDYGSSLLVALAVVWVGVVGALALRALKRQMRR